MSLISNFKRAFEVKDGIRLLGYFLAAKLSYKTLSGIYSALKTFALPLVCQRNFVEEYGEWAGKVNFVPFTI